MRLKNSTFLLAGCLIVLLMAGAFSSGLLVGLAMPKGNVLATLEQSLSTYVPTQAGSSPQTTLLTPGVTPQPTTSTGSSATPAELK